jgi:hypothetical protein
VIRNDPSGAPPRRGKRATGASRFGPVQRAVLLLACVCSASLGAGANTSADELDLKAAYMLNFIRMVNWVNAPGSPTEGIPVCALGNSGFAAAARQALAGKVVANRPVSFQIVSKPDAASCRVLIVDASQYATAGPVVKAVAKDPILTVGNGDGFLQMGGMLELVVEDGKVQFDASLEAARRSHLDISAKVFQLSRNLRRGSSGL